VPARRDVDNPVGTVRYGTPSSLRAGRFLGDLPLRWSAQRILVIGHVATRWGLDHFIGGVPLEDLVDQDFAWQEGWEYRINKIQAC